MREVSVRGKCSVCSEDVLTNQERSRSKDGSYAHKRCQELQEFELSGPDVHTPHLVEANWEAAVRIKCLFSCEVVHSNQERSRREDGSYVHKRFEDLAPKTPVTLAASQERQERRRSVSRTPQTSGDVLTPRRPSSQERRRSSLQDSPGNEESHRAVSVSGKCPVCWEDVLSNQERFCRGNNIYVHKHCHKQCHEPPAASVSIDLSQQMQVTQVQLFAATSLGDVNEVRRLVRGGANMETTNHDGDTPLSFAAQIGHVAVVQYLVQKGANKENKSNNGFTPLTAAAMYGHIGVVEYLVAMGADKESKSYIGATPLAVASEFGNLGVVECLVKMGANKDSRSDTGFTPLSVAAGHGHVGIVKFLVEMGADMESKSNGGATPMAIAAKHGHFSVVEYLVYAGASKESKSKTGFSPLTVAAGYGHVGIVEFLVKMGADKESKNNRGETALILAARNGQEQVVHCLIKLGADKAIRCDCGTTPWKAAIRVETKFLRRFSKETTETKKPQKLPGQDKEGDHRLLPSTLK